MSGRAGARIVAKVLLGLLVLLGVILVAAGVLLLTGWPQHTLLVKVLGEALDANVEVNGLSIYKDLQIGELKAIDKKAPASGAPLIDASGVKASYNVFPSGDKKRYVNAVSIDRLAVNMDHSKPAAAAAPSAAPASAGGPAPKAAPAKPAAPAKKKGKKEDTMQFVPKSLDIADGQFSIAKPTFGAEIAGIQLGAKLEGGSDRDITINGKKVSGAVWSTARDAGSRFSDGTIALHFKQGGKDYLLDPVDINLPGLLEVQGKGVAKIGDDTNIDLGFPRFIATNLDLAAASEEDFSMPVRFKKLDLSGTQLKAKASLKTFTASLADTKVNIVAEDLSLGPKDHESYQGNLSITGAAGAQSDMQLDLQATLNRGQKLTGGLSGELKDLTIRAALENWSRDDLVAALSKDLQADLEAFPGVQGLSAAFDLNVKFLAFTSAVSLKPVLAQADASEPVEFTGAFKGNILSLVTGKGQFDAVLGAKMGNGSVSVATMAGPSMRHSAKITLDKFNPGSFARVLMQSSALGAFGGALSGTMDVQAVTDWDDAKISFDLAADGLALGSLPLAPAGAPIKGTATFGSNKAGGFDKKLGLDLKLAEGTSIAIANAQFNEAKSHVDFPFELKSDLQALAGGGLFDAAKGACSISGAVKRDDSASSTKVDVDVVCESATLSNGRGAVDGLSLKAPIAYAGGKGLSGAGELKLAKAVLNGFTLSDVASAIQAEGDTIKVTGLSGKACDGTLSGDAEFGVANAAKPVKFNVQIKGMNLESMTKGFGIPALNMTGPADIAIAYAADKSGVQDLKANAESTGAVSVSTAFLETLLASTYAQQSGVKPQLEKIVKEGGKDGQTALDSLKLSLARDGENYTLTIVVAKGQRNVTIDVRMDGAALPAAASLMQQLGGAAK